MFVNFYSSIRKVIRYIAIYGLLRTWFKVAGRLSMPTFFWAGKSNNSGIGVIGCGQFAFATIGFFLRRNSFRFAICYDINPVVQNSFALAVSADGNSQNIDEFFAYPNLNTVYISSNHSTHSFYAIQALKKGINAYIEKPIAVTYTQLIDLLKAYKQSKANIFAGYNRPFSGAIKLLREKCNIDCSKGITLQCFVSGHAIASDNWYRNPEEGSRVCGNLGHWLDLFVHILSWRGLPDELMISLIVADDDHPDDNVAISISSDNKDLFSVILSTRVEPFEGVNETINFQHNDTISKIDDFRQITIWQSEKITKKRFWPKDVGHQAAIMQPFANVDKRQWNEVVCSTLLMLHITEMLRSGNNLSKFSFSEEMEHLTFEVENS